MLETQKELEKKHRDDCAELRALTQNQKMKHQRETEEMKALKSKQNTKIGDEGFQNKLMEQKKLWKQNDVTKNASMLDFESKVDGRGIKQEKLKSLQKDKWNLGNMDFLEHKNKTKKEWEGSENNFTK